MERFYIQRGKAFRAALAFIPHRTAVLAESALPAVPGTAFIIMAMNPKKPALQDVYTTFKTVCRQFGLKARRVDEIEHSETITERILKEIATSELVIADLSLERPNVYYEVGYAHALGRTPILFRKAGERLHFDLSVHKVPEYRNTTELAKLLRERLKDRTVGAKRTTARAPRKPVGRRKTAVTKRR